MSSMIIRRTAAILLALAFISCALCISFNNADASNENGAMNDDLPVIKIKNGKADNLPDTCTWDEGTYTLVINGGEYGGIQCDYGLLSSNDDTVFNIVVNGDCKVTLSGKAGMMCIGSSHSISISGDGSLTLNGHAGIYSTGSAITINKLKSLTINADILAIGYLKPRSADAFGEGKNVDIIIQDCESVNITFNKISDFAAINTESGSVTIMNSTVKITAKPQSTDVTIISSTEGIITDYVGENVKCYDSERAREPTEYSENTKVMRCASGETCQVSEFVPEPEPTPSNTGMDNLTVAVVCIAIVLLLIAHMAFISKRY